MKLTYIAFDRQSGKIDHVHVTLEDMVDTPTDEFGCGELGADFTLPITPEIDQWIMLTLGTLHTEIQKHVGARLE